MKYTWDNEKNDKNYKKHGIWFEEACTAFADINALEIFDEEHSDAEEDRYILLGLSSAARLLVVVYCERVDNETRIISARKATKNERLTYEKRI